MSEYSTALAAGHEKGDPMTVPNGVVMHGGRPWIDSGGHSFRRGHCMRELLHLLIYGEQKDALPCVDDLVSSVIPSVNDRLTADGRQRLAMRAADVLDCGQIGDDAARVRVYRRLALWAARQVEHLTDDQRVGACNDVTERYLRGAATREDLAKAEAAAGAAKARARAAEAAEAAAWAAGAEAAEAAVAARVAAAWAAAEAAWAATGAGDDALLDFFDGFLSQWQKVAADEGCLADMETAEAEQVAFVCEFIGRGA